MLALLADYAFCVVSTMVLRHMKNIPRRELVWDIAGICAGDAPETHQCYPTFLKPISIAQQCEINAQPTNHFWTIKRYLLSLRRIQPSDVICMRVGSIWWHSGAFDSASSWSCPLPWAQRSGVHQEHSRKVETRSLRHSSLSCADAYIRLLGVCVRVAIPLQAFEEHAKVSDRIIITMMRPGMKLILERLKWAVKCRLLRITELLKLSVGLKPSADWFWRCCPNNPVNLNVLMQDDVWVRLKFVIAQGASQFNNSDAVAL